jgi:hypothetical protein
MEQNKTDKKSKRFPKVITFPITTFYHGSGKKNNENMGLLENFGFPGKKPVKNVFFPLFLSIFIPKILQK